MIVKPISWSFSALEQFRNCPKQYQEVRVLKNFKEEYTDERRWGDRVHKALADYLMGAIVVLPEGMTVWQTIADQFKGLTGTLYAENQFAIDAGFKPCNWKDWDNAWLRGIVDALWINGTVAKAIDWKTGKRKPNSDQLALFALLVFCHFPQVQTVRTMFVWLKTADKDREDFTREDIPRLWSLFTNDLQRLKNCMETNTWIPKTSGLCSAWCPVVTCQYNGKRRNW